MDFDNFWGDGKLFGQQANGKHPIMSSIWISKFCDCSKRTPMQCGRRLVGVEHSTNRLYRAIKKKVRLRSLTGSSNMCCLEMLKLSESCGC